MKNLIKLLEDPTYLLINRVELECELADAEMLRVYGKDKYASFQQKYEGVTTWTPEGQDIFNDLVDYFNDIILKCSVGTSNAEQPAEQQERPQEPGFNDDQLCKDVTSGKFNGIASVSLNLEETAGGDGRGERTWELSVISYAIEIVAIYTYYDRQQAEDDAAALMEMYPTWNDDDVTYRS